MRVKMRCPNCRQVLMAREDDLGKQLRCPRCKKMMTVSPRKPAPTPPPRASAPARPPGIVDSLFEDIEADRRAERAIPLASAPADPVGPYLSRSAAAPPGPPLPMATPAVAPFGGPMSLPYGFGVGVGPRLPQRRVVPTVVRVYGLIIMVLNLIAMGLTVLATVIALARVSEISVRHNVRGGGAAVGALLFGGAIQLALNYFMFRVGRALREGRRWAVITLCVLAGLALIGALVVIGGMSAAAQGEDVDMGPMMGGVSFCLLAIIAALYVPPLVSAFRHWDQFE